MRIKGIGIAAGLGLKKPPMAPSEDERDVSHLSGNVARGVVWCGDAGLATAARLVPNVENHLTRNLETR
jgi:hypothetical protein